jgi:hypothetical protein
MTPEELLSLLGWIPQEDWQRREVADLVHALAVSDDAVEVRRWFRRPQASLGRRTPLEALRLAKRPDDELVVELRRLALAAYR